ncbi:hypothetical protein AbraIFM66950_009142, partial [Aspergillus brasiliensis]
MPTSGDLVRATIVAKTEQPCEFGWKTSSKKRGAGGNEVSKMKVQRFPRKRRAAGGPRSGRFSEQA